MSSQGTRCIIAPVLAFLCLVILLKCKGMPSCFLNTKCLYCIMNLFPHQTCMAPALSVPPSVFVLQPMILNQLRVTLVHNSILLLWGGIAALYTQWQIVRPIAYNNNILNGVCLLHIVMAAGCVRIMLWTYSMSFAYKAKPT